MQKKEDTGDDHQQTLLDVVLEDNSILDWEPVFRQLGPVYGQKKLKKIKDFKCRVIRKKAESTPYFVGVALLEGGGIDFYHNYTLVFSHDPVACIKKDKWKRAENPDATLQAHLDLDP